MDDSTKDRADGTLHEAKGKIKEVAGRMTGNEDLEARGTAEKLGGKVERKVGDAEKTLGD